MMALLIIGSIWRLSAGFRKPATNETINLKKSTISCGPNDLALNKTNRSIPPAENGTLPCHSSSLLALPTDNRLLKHPHCSKS